MYTNREIVHLLFMVVLLL